MKKILVVDDEPIIANGITAMIQGFQLNLAITTRYSAEEALAFSQTQALDIIITDINMPVINGIELIRLIRQTNPQTQIIVLTGFGTFEYAKESMELGVRYFIQKPCQPDELRRSLLDSLELVAETDQMQQLRLQQVIEATILDKTTVSTIQVAPFYLILFDSKNYHLLSKWFNHYLAEADSLSGSIKKAAYYVVFSDAYHGQKLIKQLPLDKLPRCTIFHSEFIQIAELYDTFRGGLKAFEKEFYVPHITVLNTQQLSQASSAQKNNQLYLTFRQDILALIESAEFTKGQLAIQQFFTTCQDILYPVKLLQIECNDLITKLIAQYKIQTDKLASELSIKIVLSSSVAELHYLVMSIFDLVKEANCSTDGNIAASLNRIIEEHFNNEDLSLRWISKNLLFLNPEYLGKAYFKQTGNKFNQQLVEFRMEKAKQLLAEDYRVYEVAKLVGFGNNPEYFSQVFKRHSGMTPHRYTKKEHTSTQ